MTNSIDEDLNKWISDNEPSIRYWRQLVKRYSDGRPICNCGYAYYSPCGEGIDEKGRRRKDMLTCKSGCSANQISARDEIAKRVLLEIIEK